MSKPKWEEAGPGTMRLAVPGGWLYGVMVGNCARAAVAFVPGQPRNVEAELACAVAMTRAWHIAFDALASAFRVNMLRISPSTSHAEIDAIIEAILNAASQGGRIDG